MNKGYLPWLSTLSSKTKATSNPRRNYSNRKTTTRLTKDSWNFKEALKSPNLAPQDRVCRQKTKTSSKIRLNICRVARLTSFSRSRVSRTALVRLDQMWSQNWKSQQKNETGNIGWHRALRTGLQHIPTSKSRTWTDSQDRRSLFELWRLNCRVFA